MRPHSNISYSPITKVSVVMKKPGTEDLQVSQVHSEDGRKSRLT